MPFVALETVCFQSHLGINIFIKYCECITHCPFGKGSWTDPNCAGGRGRLGLCMQRLHRECRQHNEMLWPAFMVVPIQCPDWN